MFRCYIQHLVYWLKIAHVLERDLVESLNDERNLFLTGCSWHLMGRCLPACSVVVRLPCLSVWSSYVPAPRRPVENLTIF